MKNKIEYPHYPPRFLVLFFERMRHVLMRLNRRFTHPNVAVFEMAHNLWLAASLNVAAELGIADLLKEGGKSIHELAHITDTHEESLYRMMRMLASQGIFREQKNRVFTLTPLAEALQENNMKFLMTSHLSKRQFHLFGEMIYTIRTGKSASEIVIGDKVFDHLGKDSAHNEHFINAMTNVSLIQISTIVPVYPFGKYKNMIDIGGGEGLMMAALLQKYPRSRGIVFDLPQSADLAIKFIERYGIDDRCTFVAGSFFDSIPEGGDLYIMKNILHDWNDESCLIILRNIAMTMPSDSRLLIIDPYVAEGNRPSFGKMTDMLMMTALGGKERTRDEFRILLDQAGLRILKIQRTISQLIMIEAEKK
jgi:O-methyltransferase domain